MNGKLVRLKRLFRQGTRKMLLVPFDDSLLSGPEGGLRRHDETIKAAIESGADAIMGFSSIFKFVEWIPSKIGLVLNVTASTTRMSHTRKVLLSNVEQAVRLGADCVAVHVNITSQFEAEMLRNLGTISQECENLGIPLMGIMYPRSESAEGDNNYWELRETNREQYAHLVRHAVRVGVECGADIIKTQYTGDEGSFATVVESSCNVPIVVAGGPLDEFEVAIDKAKGAMAAGASGVSFGRNVYQRIGSEVRLIVNALCEVVHGNSD